MSEKSLKSSRILLCLITIAMSLLILSSVVMLQSTALSSIPSSVFRQIIVNRTVLFNTNGDRPNNQTSLVSTIGTEGPKLRENVSGCRSANVVKRVAVNIGEKNKRLCGPNQGELKVYMYDLPPEFHFGLLGWKGKSNQIWPDVRNPDHIPSYPGGLNLQHSMEYWLILDLLLSTTSGVSRPCTAVRVGNSSVADVILVPFFSSLSYNRYSKLHGREKVSMNSRLQNKLVEFLTSRDEWKRCRGRNHVIVAHHPNSMLDARGKLGSAIFVLSDFGRYSADVANLEKDIIVPYRHVVKSAVKSVSFDERPILAFFQGAIYRKDGGVIRQELYYLLKDEKDVHFTFGTVRGDGVSKAGEGMAASKFCLNIAGDTPSSNRLFDAIVSHCVPVIISDEIELPFEDVLDYSKFSIFVRGSDAVKKGFLLNLLRGISREEWTKMYERLKEVAQHFEYRYPSEPEDAVDMTWKAIARKISSVQLRRHREHRLYRS
ncbi:hypothetical protein Syun_023629 [Stephania yunnanensis]|uniref:Exostosin GT47 domain-containing protein n=1 Tax=Stephania yunnanensis TaxID=152371 RepID=A0AAP0FNF7_9MAGN